MCLIKWKCPRARLRQMPFGTRAVRKGPFVPLREGWKQRVMDKALKRVSSTKAHHAGSPVLEIHPEVEDHDLVDIASYIAKDNPDAAGRVMLIEIEQSGQYS